MIRLLLTSGRGPAECRIALTRVLAVMTDEAAEAGLDIDVAPGPAPDAHGPGSAVTVIQGEGAVSALALWHCTSVRCENHAGHFRQSAGCPYDDGTGRRPVETRSRRRAPDWSERQRE